MKRYKIYSGTKPSSVNKTFAVNWGNKYFTVSSGYSYISPIVVKEIYDNDANPTKVTFLIENRNSVALSAQLDLYVGVGTSGTRVDYWKVGVPAMGQATCPNTWRINKGSTYTLSAYFMSYNAGYHGTAVSGSTQYKFTVMANA